MASLGQSQDDLVKNEAPPAGRDQHQVSLKKKIGLTSALAFIIGSVIGSGIFISPKGVVLGVGSVGATLCIWLLCGLISFFFSFIYAELGSFIHLQGGDYTYIQLAFKDFHPFFGPLPAFLFIWMKLLLITPASMAILALTFSNYVVDPFFDECGPPEVIVKTMAASAILTVTGINVISVGLGASVMVIFTALKTSAVVMISVMGVVRIFQGSTQYLSTGFEDSVMTPGSVAIACYKGLWAYAGWDIVNVVAEEIINPKRNIPLSIFLGISIVTAVYMLTNVSYFTVLSPQTLMASSAVAVSWGDVALGSAAWLIPLSVSCSVFGGLNGSAFGNGRYWFAAAREGHLPSVLAMVHVQKVTPAPAIIFQSILGLIYIGLTDIFTLINYTQFAEWGFKILIVASTIIFRFTKKDAKRKFSTPWFIIIINILICLFLTVVPVANHPRMEFLYATLVILGGVFIYIPFVFYKVHIPFSDTMTQFLQLFLEVSPTTVPP